VNWSEQIVSHQPGARLFGPAPLSRIAATQEGIGVRLPEELAGLLTQSDGVRDVYGSSLIWSAQEIAERNREFRTFPDYPDLYMPFDHLLFFGDAGNGDRFFYPILAGEVRNRDAFAWFHEDDSRVWVAPRLATFIEWWFSGRIKL
jgi:hypothetical protein